MFVLEDDANAQAQKKHLAISKLFISFVLENVATAQKKNIWKSQNFLLSLYQKLIIKIFKGIML